MRHIFLKIASALLLTASSSAFAQAPPLEWIATIDSGTTISDATRVIRRMNNGDIIAASQVNTGPTTIRVTRHNGATGAVMWTTDQAPGTSNDTNDMVIDPATGDAYLASPVSITGQQQNWYISKLRGSDGVVQWTNSFNSPSNANDAPRSICMTSDGNVVVAGQYSLASVAPSTRVAKYNASTGAQMWAFEPTAEWQDFFQVVADGAGNAIAVGHVNAASVATENGYVVKFNAGGTVVWSQSINGAANDFDGGLTVDVDSAGNVYAAVASRVVPGMFVNDDDILVVKMAAATGAEQWRRSISGALVGSDFPSFLTLDASDNVYVGGAVYESSASNTDAFLAKLNPTTGGVVWSITKAGTSGTGSELFRSIALNGSEVYAASLMNNTVSATAQNDIYIGRFNPASGATLWEINYNSSGTRNDQISTRRGGALIAGATDAVFVAGQSQNPAATQPDGVILKYAPAVVTPTISIAVAPASVSEDGATNLIYTVTSSPAIASATTVNISTSGTATTGSDYTGGVTTLTIPANTASATITINPAVDGTVEADETVILTVAAGTGYTVGAPASATGTILNDDVPSASIAVLPTSVVENGAADLVYTVTLNQASLSAISVNFNVSGTATSGTDFAAVTSPLVISAGNTTGTITVNPNGDTTIESDETAIITLATGSSYTVGAPASATGTIANDDLPNLTINDVTANEGNAGITNFTFTLSLSAPAPTGGVGFSIATANGTATAGVDYVANSLTAQAIPAGSSTYTFTVLANGDALNEVSETFFVNVTSLTNANALDVQGLGTITNDDPLPSLSINDVSVTEGNSGTTNAVFTVTLSAASGQTVQVNYATADDTTSQPADYTSTSGTLTFGPVQTTRTITVLVNGETVPEANETFFVNLSGATNATITDTQGIGTITNDDVPVTVSPASLPNGTVAAAYSQTITASGGVAPYGFAVTAGALPTGLILSSGGVLGGTPTAGGTFNFTVTATDSSGAPGPFAGSRSYTVTIAPPTIVLPATALVGGTLGVVYSAAITPASGGTSPYAYAVTTGALPGGLNLNTATGAITGTPSSLGTFNFSITATDSSTGTGPYTAIQAYSVVVIAVPPTASNSSLTVAYNAPATNVPLTLSGGAPTSVAIVTPAANGTAIANGTTITYQPTAGFAGSDSFTYTATNSGGPSAPATVTTTVSDPVITIMPSGGFAATVGTPYTQTFTFNGGAQPWSGFQVTNLPSGLSITGTTANSVTVSGTPTQAGSFNLNASATDSSTGNGPYTVGQAFTLAVAAPTLALAPAATTFNAPYGTAYSQSFTASGGIGPYTYARTGTLPPGVSFSGNTVSGIATAPGSFSFTITATDTGATGTGSPFTIAQNYTIEVAAPTIVVNPAMLPNPTAGTAYSQTISASVGVAPYSTTVTSGSLPSGITLTTGGVLSGTSNDFGTFNFTVTATDANGQTGSRAYTLTINAPTLTINDVSIVEGNGGAQELNFTVTRTGTTGSAVGFNFAVADGTATVGDSDYVAASGTGTIPSGGATQSTQVTVMINGDAVFENDESVLVNLTVPSNAVITDAQGVGTITNDDSAPTLAINDVSLVEGNSGTQSMVFTVTRTGLTALPASFTTTAVDGSATEPSDYLMAITGSTSIAAGGATGTTTMSVTINGDLTIEANETFSVDLTVPVNATLADGTGVGTITNDDGEPTFTPAGPITRQQGSPVAIATLGTVSDLTDPANSLAVAIIADTTTGVTTTGLANSNGTVTASLAASCTASAGSLSVRVTDSGGLTDTDTVQINVSPNTSPALAYGTSNVSVGNSLTITPSTALSDNGSVASVTVLSSGTFTGGISVSSSGVISLSNATPAGNHTLVIRVTDNCGANTDVSVALTIGQASTFKLITSNVAPSRFGEAVTFSVGLSGVDPTGTVEFFAGVTRLGTAPLVASPSGGANLKLANLTTSALPVGTSVITARYAGDVNNTASTSADLAHIVNSAGTRITLTPAANPVPVGNVSIAVQVAPEAPGGGVPAGSVTLTSGALSCAAALNAGAGSCTLNFASVGYQAITASYTPTGSNHSASIGGSAIVIVASPSSTDLRVRIGNGVSNIGAGQGVSYLIVVDNIGTQAAVGRLQVPISADFTGASYTCISASLANCGTSGTGSIDQELSLAPGGVVIYRLQATAPIAPERLISQTANIITKAPTTDTDATNNSAGDVDPMGLLADGYEDAAVTE